MKPKIILSSVLKRRTPAVTITVFAAVLVAMLLSSGYVSPASGPKVIDGYIKDSAGRPMEGASVLLEVWTPPNYLVPTFTDSYTSDETGYYSFTMGAVEWNDGDLFNVTATYLGNQKRSSAFDDGQPLQRIDVTFPFEIPQFGSLLGFGIAAGAVGLVAMVFVVKRKKD